MLCNRRRNAFGQPSANPIPLPFRLFSIIHLILICNDHGQGNVSISSTGRPEHSAGSCGVAVCGVSGPCPPVGGVVEINSGLIVPEQAVRSTFQRLWPPMTFWCITRIRADAVPSLSSTTRLDTRSFCPVPRFSPLRPELCMSTAGSSSEYLEDTFAGWAVRRTTRRPISLCVVPSERELRADMILLPLRPGHPLYTFALVIAIPRRFHSAATFSVSRRQPVPMKSRRRTGRSELAAASLIGPC